MITLRVRPGTVVSWPTFQEESPAFSVALDGYVSTGPRYDPDGPRVNFNHHEDVDRLATRSTCAQVLMSIRQGMFTRFRDANGAVANVVVNDCDEDVCTAWALLRHHYLVTGTMNPAVNRLVAMEDALDCTAGAYPFPADLPALEELAWVFQPYRLFRASGALERLDPRAYEAVIYDVELRFLQHVTGHGKALPLDTRFDRIGGGTGWALIREVGAQARTGVFAEGIRAFVSVRERADGRYGYVIGKMSPFIPLDLRGLVADLNEADGAAPDLWGGGDIVIGSPRRGGSRLTPTEVSAMVDARFGRATRGERP